MSKGKRPWDFGSRGAFHPKGHKGKPVYSEDGSRSSV